MEELERDCAARRLQDHEHVERGDAVVVIDVCGEVPVAGGCELERDCGVGGGADAVGVEVTFRGIAPSTWLYNCTQDSDIMALWYLP